MPFSISYEAAGTRSGSMTTMTDSRLKQDFADERLRDWLLARVDGDRRGHYHRIIERYFPDRERAIGHDALQACSADNRSSRQT
jgi:hypothetical protein